MAESTAGGFKMVALPCSSWAALLCCVDSDGFLVWLFFGACFVCVHRVTEMVAMCVWMSEMGIKMHSVYCSRKPSKADWFRKDSF